MHIKGTDTRYGPVRAFGGLSGIQLRTTHVDGNRPPVVVNSLPTRTKKRVSSRRFNTDTPTKQQQSAKATIENKPFSGIPRGNDDFSASSALCHPREDLEIDKGLRLQHAGTCGIQESRRLARRRRRRRQAALMKQRQTSGRQSRRRRRKRGMDRRGTADDDDA